MHAFQGGRGWRRWCKKLQWSAVARGRVEEEGNRGEREEARRKKKRRGIRREKETKKAPITYSARRTKEEYRETFPLIRFDLVWLAIRILAESTLISPSVPFHLAGFLVIFERISRKTGPMIGYYFLRFVFSFSSSIPSFIPVVCRLAEHSDMDPVTTNPEISTLLASPGPCCVSTPTVFLSHERLSVYCCCSVLARLSILICRRTRMQFPLAASGLLTDEIVPIWGILFIHSSLYSRLLLANGEFQNGLQAEREFAGRFSVSSRWKLGRFLPNWLLLDITSYSVRLSNPTSTFLSRQWETRRTLRWSQDHPTINPSEPSPIITSNTLRSTYVRIVYNSAISIIYGNIPLEYRGSSHSRGPAMLPMHKSHRDVGWQSSTRLFIFKSRNTDWSSITHAVSHGGHNLQRKSVREIEKDCNRLSCTEYSVSPKKVLTDQQN